MNLIIYSGIQSIISQFNVNPFRWPGWFISAMGGSFILAVLVIFKETKNCSVSTPTCTPVKQLSLLKCFSRKVSFYCILVSFTTYTHVWSMIYDILDLLMYV